MRYIGKTEKRINQAIENRKHLLFVLIDSENTKKDFGKQCEEILDCDIDAFLVGGSTIADQTEVERTIITIKKICDLPVILFPGNITGISRHADAILFSSLLNSDDPYFIIGAQALGAPLVRKYHLEAIPMAYMIIGEGQSAGFVGKARPFPPSKPELVAAYALAAEYLGMRFTYLEAGSGAPKSIDLTTIKIVKSISSSKLIVGGGIRTAKIASEIAMAGADILVVGNLVERNNFKPILKSISNSIHSR